MDEVRQEANDGQSGRSHALWTTLSVMLGIYLFFLVLYMEPFHLAYGNSYPPKLEHLLDIFFAPVTLLAHSVPLYERLIMWECRLLGIQ